MLKQQAGDTDVHLQKKKFIKSFVWTGFETEHKIL